MEPAGSRATWAGKPERASEREASESTPCHLFCVVGFDAVGFQVSAKLGEMFVVSCFNRAKHIHGRDIRTRESAIVYNLFNACSGCRDLLAQIGQAAWSIADHGGESR